MERYGPGSVPLPEPSLYARKEELISRLTRRHELVERIVQVKHQDYFSRTPPAPFDGLAPSIDRIIVYLLAVHESYYLGQLMDWKRVSGIH